ncbi:MAG: methyltransferase domain-containing protein [Anaerolineae bacterium]
MTWTWIGLGVASVVGLIVLAYWQLVLAEGTYLGPRMVARTYDWVASRYDAIKQYQPGAERWFVAGPVLRGLQGIQHPLILDVATGTGRLPLALLRERFRGEIIGLDLSSGMLRQARANLGMYAEQVTLVQQDASHLPFDDGQFDAVTCMESLEFMPRPLDVLAEMVRVLAPGGILFLTNRVGWEARWLPRRAIGRPAFKRALAGLGLVDIEVRPWQVNYDLAAARKPPGQQRMADGENLVSGHVPVAQTPANGRGLDVLRCSTCGGRLDRRAGALVCSTCTLAFPIRDGVIYLANPGKRVAP